MSAASSFLPCPLWVPPQAARWTTQGLEHLFSIPALPSRELCNPRTRDDASWDLCMVCTNHNELSFAPLLPALSMLILSHLWECCCHLDSFPECLTPQVPFDLTHQTSLLHFSTSEGMGDLKEMSRAARIMAREHKNGHCTAPYWASNTRQCLRKHSGQLPPTQQFHDKVASELITALVFHGSKVY